MYQALYRKWRPQVFADVVGQNHVTRTLKNQSAVGRLSHAYLFCGTRGTGKTTCARILAKAVNCLNPKDGDPCNRCDACLGINDGSMTDIVEIDAATYTGVDDIRALREEAIYSPTLLKKRVYIIDEVHMLSTSAFNAFLKILEEPPAHVMFILATTELSKVPATVLSRCQRFDFKRIDHADISKELLKVSAAEGFRLDEKGASLIADMSDGAMRNALSLLEQAAASGAAALTSEAVYRALGLMSADPLLSLARDIASGDSRAALSLFSQKYDDGVDPAAFASQLICLFRDLLMCKTGASCAYLGSGYTANDLSSLTGLFSAERLVYSINTLRDCARNLDKSPSKRVDAELCLVLLCKPSVSGEATALASRVSELERRLASGAISVVAPEKADIRPVPETVIKPSPAEKPVSAASESFSKRSELISLLRDRLDFGTLSHIKLCEMTLRGDKLCLSSSEPTTLKIAGSRTSLDAVSSAACELCGRPVRAVTELSSPASASVQDNGLDSLLNFAAQNPDIASIK